MRRITKHLALATVWRRTNFMSWLQLTFEEEEKM